MSEVNDEVVDLRTGIINNREFYGIKFHQFYTPKRRKLVGVRTYPGRDEESLRNGFEPQMYEIDIDIEELTAVVKRDGEVLFSLRELQSEDENKLEAMTLSALRSRIRRNIAAQLKKARRRARKALARQGGGECAGTYFTPAEVADPSFGSESVNKEAEENAE